MAFSTVTYTVTDTGEDTYAIPFGFLRDGNLTVELNGSALTPTTDYEVDTDEIVLDASVVLLVDDLITITRTTPLTDAGQYVTFADAAAPRRDDLETFRKQHLYALQEASDNSTSGLQLDLADSKWDAQDLVIKDLADPVEDQDAATKVWVETAFATGGVLPTPASGDALKFLRVNSGETGYTLTTSLAERYIFRIATQSSGPAGYVGVNGGGFQCMPHGSDFNNGEPTSNQRCPLTLVSSYGDIGQVSLATNTFDLTLGIGQWEIEANVHLRGLTDGAAGVQINATEGQMAITGSTGTVYASSPEVLTGVGIEVQDSGASIPKHIRMSPMVTVRYIASFGSPTIINLRARGSTSSNSVVADVPSYLRVQRIIR